MSIRKVLIVDDDPATLESLSRLIKTQKHTTWLAGTAEKAITLFKKNQPDLILLDWNLPDTDGLTVLKNMRAINPYIPIIIISGMSDKKNVIEALESGADDFIIKPYESAEMLARVNTQLRIKGLNESLQLINARLKELVDKDDLTGLLNMRSIYQRIEGEVDRARRYKRQVCAVMMDLDFFKTVNDAHNHLFGSYVLSEIGKIILKTIRSIDVAARYGGDEFLIILTETDIQGARKFCERLRQNISETLFVLETDEVRLTASFGLAITPVGDSVTSPKDLVKFADKCLYEAKKAGRNCIRVIEIPASPYKVPPTTNRKTEAS